MTSRDFAYWLQGFFEITDPKLINEKQTEMIKRHLSLVFFHEIDPSYSNDKEVLDEMLEIHNPKPTKPPREVHHYHNDSNAIIKC